MDTETPHYPPRLPAFSPWVALQDHGPLTSRRYGVLLLGCGLEGVGFDRYVGWGVLVNKIGGSVLLVGLRLLSVAGMGDEG